MGGLSLKSHKLTPWLSWGLTATFLIAIFSGLVVSYPYREEHPLISTVGLETVIPFGAFFRALHYFSGQLTLLLLLWHTGEALWARRERVRPWWAWTALVLSVPATLLILFTGYIIRGDETGFCAGRIAEHLAKSLPVLGTILDHLFFLVSQDGVHRAWLAHLYLSGVVFGLTSLWHFRLRALRASDLAAWASMCAVLALLLPASLDAPTDATLIKGPWFFLGVQELLRYLPPLLAGIVFPSIPALSLLGFYWRPRLAVVVLGNWLVAYAFLTIMGALR